MPEPPFDSIKDAVAEIANGRAVIVTDDESRENEGDLIFAAEKVTPQLVNQMVRYGSGVVCVPMLPHHLDRLGIAPMVSNNREAMRTDYAVSVDAADGITTGISAYDRAETIRVLANPSSTADALVRPGHVFPLRARPGGVLQRAGHTEAAVDLASLAGLFPAGVICELVKEDGDMMRLPDLVKFKEDHGLKLINIADLIAYRHTREQLVEKVATLPFESAFGQFELHIFRNFLDDRQHFALTLGRLSAEPTLVRVQSENLLGDVFRARAFKGHNALERAMELISKEGRGVVLYIEQPNGGIRLEASGDGQQISVGPMHMDFRDYGIGAQILAQLGLRQIRLLTTKARKVVALDGYDLEIVEQIPLGQ